VLERQILYAIAYVAHFAYLLGANELNHEVLGYLSASKYK